MIQKIKTEDHWLVQFELAVKDVHVGQWTAPSWNISHLHFPLDDNNKLPLGYELPFVLHKDERAEYRFNLSSATPKLFFIFEERDDDTIAPLKITAAQSIASGCMQSEQLVLAMPIPLKVQMWMEAFISRHGEPVLCGRKENKKAGRMQDV